MKHLIKLNEQVIADRSLLISALSEALYPSMQLRYFAWLDHCGHYGYYDLIIELVDEVMFSDGAKYKSVLHKVVSEDFDWNDYSNECFDWYHINQAEKLLKERMKGWEGTNKDFVQDIIKMYADSGEVCGTALQKMIESIGMKEQLMKQWTGGYIDVKETLESYEDAECYIRNIIDSDCISAEDKLTLIKAKL